MVQKHAAYIGPPAPKAAGGPGEPTGTGTSRSRDTVIEMFASFSSADMSFSTPSTAASSRSVNGIKALLSGVSAADIAILFGLAGQGV